MSSTLDFTLLSVNQPARCWRSEWFSPTLLQGVAYDLYKYLPPSLPVFFDSLRHFVLSFALCSSALIAPLPAFSSPLFFLLNSLFLLLSPSVLQEEVGSHVDVVV